MDKQKYTVNDLIRDELYKNMDSEYGRFMASSVPGCGNIIGVRLPVLHRMAQEIAKVNWKEYLNGALDDTYEELMLQALVIGYARGKTEDIFLYLAEIVPKLDNWCVCDTLCAAFKLADSCQEETWEFIMQYIKPEATEFELRFAVVMMLNYFLNDKYIDKVLFAYNSIHHDGYYLKMGIAWGLAEAYAKYPGKTMSLLQDNDIDDETFNMAIQKMRESRRVSHEDKAMLKEMKR
jgi:3-methyladenine DNA glycosylase AlkD